MNSLRHMDKMAMDFTCIEGCARHHKLLLISLSAYHGPALPWTSHLADH